MVTELIPPGPQAGFIWISNPGSNERTTVPESRLQSYLDDGWVLGCNYSTTPGYIWINNGYRESRVPEAECARYLSCGWKVGRIVSTKGYIMIHRDSTQTSVPSDQLDSYLAQGWERGEIPGRHFKGFCILREKFTGKVIHVNQEDKHQYLDSGDYEEKNALVGTVHIHKDGVAKMVSVDELPSYLDAGWCQGRKAYTANKIWICRDDTKENLRVDASDLESYLAKGWRKGRILNRKK